MRWAPTCWPIAACCGPPSSYIYPLAPRPPTKSSTDGTTGLPRTLFTQPAGAVPRRVGWVFRGRSFVPGVFSPDCGGFKAAGGMEDPRARCSDREGYSHTQLSPLPYRHVFFYSPRIYPLLPRTLLVKAVLLPKMLLPECFIGRG